MTSLQSRLSPKSLQNGYTPPPETVLALHLAPASLERYARELQSGLEADGVITVCVVANKEEDPESLWRRACDERVRLRASRPSAGMIELLLVEWHGAEYEVPIVEAVLAGAGSAGANIQSRTVVLVHRPEEILLRYGVREVLRMLSGADAVVLLGLAWVREYQQLFPGKAVVAIPHGFFEPGHVGDLFRYDGDTVAVVGSCTTWGEMRHLDDLLELNGSMKQFLDDGECRAICYASGTFQDRHVDAETILKQSDKLVLVNNEEIVKAIEKGEVKSPLTFREWLHTVAKGRTVVRGKVVDGKLVGEVLPSEHRHLEEDLVDFNVQFYHEVLGYKREEDNGLLSCMKAPLHTPKVEYSGTLHAKGGPALGVVLRSSAMLDVSDYEGVKVVMVPQRDDGTIDFATGAAQIVMLIVQGDKRLALVEDNVAIAYRLSMKVVATAYLRLAAEAWPA